MLKIVFDLLDFEEVEIVPIADVHIGNPLCNEAEFKRIIDYVLEEPDNPKTARICLLNGDLTESVTRTTKAGNVFDQAMSPQMQMATVIKYLEPLAETKKGYPNGKILSYCAGNHDFGRYSDTGIAISDMIAVKLGLEDRYSTNGCYSFVRTKKLYDNRDPSVFTIYNQHMTGGGSTIGGKANRVAKISNGVIADVIVGSHVHSPITFKEDVIVPDYRMKALTQKTITYVVTGAFLRFGDYSQRNGMKPSTIATPKIYLRQGQSSRTNNKYQQRFTYIETSL